MGADGRYPEYRQDAELDESTRDMTVELIRERVARKEYQVDSDAVAAAILERLLAVRPTDEDPEKRP